MNRLADPGSRSMGPERSGFEGCLVSGSVSVLIICRGNDYGYDS